MSSSNREKLLKVYHETITSQLDEDQNPARHGAGRAVLVTMNVR